MTEYSPTHNKPVDLGTEHQFQLTSQKERTRYYVPSDEKHTMTYSLAKRLYLSLLKPLDPCINIQRTEEPTELHHESAISKIQIMGKL